MQQRNSLDQFLATRLADRSDGAQLSALILDVASACADIAQLLRGGQLAGVLGAAGQQNVQGEDQKKLDVIANDLFIETMQSGGLLAGLASEEMEQHYPIPNEYARGRYLLTFDPLDGSSNIDVNGSTGTIFSILEYDGSAAPGDADFLQAGTKQVCAGYCLYSSASMLMLTIGDGVFGFTLNAEQNSFLLSHPNMRVPNETNEFSINAAYSEHWQAPVQQYIKHCIEGESGPFNKNYNMRWAGSMVGDIHRVLCRGGIFLYPLDQRMVANNVEGKLRLLYEANPMGMLVEQAGGVAHTGLVPILDIDPQHLHQRVPVIMGSAQEVQRVIDNYANAV